MVGDTVSVHGEVFPPFTHYLELFGYQNAIIGLVKIKLKSRQFWKDSRMQAHRPGRAGKARVDAVLISSSAFVQARDLYHLRCITNWLSHMSAGLRKQLRLRVYLCIHTPVEKLAGSPRTMADTEQWESIR